MHNRIESNRLQSDDFKVKEFKINKNHIRMEIMQIVKSNFFINNNNFYHDK